MTDHEVRWHERADHAAALAAVAVAAQEVAVQTARADRHASGVSSLVVRGHEYAKEVAEERAVRSLDAWADAELAAVEARHASRAHHGYAVPGQQDLTTTSRISRRPRRLQLRDRTPATRR